MIKGAGGRPALPELFFSHQILHISKSITPLSATGEAHDFSGGLALDQFPELEYGDMEAYRQAEQRIDQLYLKMHCRPGPGVLALDLMAEAVKRRYLALDPILARFTGPVCARCATGCCVNRHGFPDYEDLVLFRALGVDRAQFDPTLPDQDLCQYLGEKGCILQRFERSYRCTWFFCDELLDDFEIRKPKAFLLFEEGCTRLARSRNRFLDAYRLLVKGVSSPYT